MTNLEGAPFLPSFGRGGVVASAFVLGSSDVCGGDPLRGIACVHYNLRFGNDALVVVAAVVGDDEDGVVLPQVLERRARHVEGVVTSMPHRGEEWIVVFHLGPRLAQQLDDGERGRLAQVVDVALVGQPQHQDARAVQAFLVLVQRQRGLLDHIVGHVGVDFARQLDEARAEVELLGLPGEIKRVDGDAVPAESRAGIKRLKTEGLGLGRIDHLEDVDVHALAELLEFVDQCNVHASVNVFQQLSHLRRRRR